MTEPKILPKKDQHRMKLIIIIISITIIGAGLLCFAGIHFLIPKPLTLKPGEMIRGKMTLNTHSPHYIGDLIPVTISVESRNGVTFQMPDLADANIKPLEIKVRSPLVMARLQGGQLQKMSYQLIAWGPGIYFLPYCKVQYKDPGIKIRPEKFGLTGWPAEDCRLIPYCLKIKPQLNC